MAVADKKSWSLIVHTVGVCWEIPKQKLPIRSRDYLVIQFYDSELRTVQSDVNR